MSHESSCRLICFDLLMIALFSLSISGQAMSDKKPESVTLAQDGKALLPIVTASTNATPAEQTAARELAEYLGKITGAKFEKVEEKDLPPDAPAIFLGNTRFAREQGIDITKLGEEESILKTVGGSLIITGGRPRGTLYAVYIFLEDVLGCRWYAPWCEKVPSQPACRIPELNKRFTPAFSMRDIYSYLVSNTISFEAFKWYVVRNRLNGPSLGYGIWLQYNKTNNYWALADGGVGGGCVARYGGPHSFFRLIPDKEYFKDHPEFFSERNGKRVATSDGGDGNHLCLTNPDMRKVMIGKVRENMRKFPDMRVFSVSPNDGGCKTACDCPKCTEFAAKYSWSDLHYDFLNEIADAVREEFPSNYIYTLAYSYPQDPPKVIMPKDNIIVQSCHLASGSVIWEGIKDGKPLAIPALEGWAKVTRNLWAWDYSQWGSLYQFMYPTYFRMAEQLKLCKRLGVKGVFAENEVITRMPMVSEFYVMRMWLMAKLMQDPDRDINTLIRDYLDGYYGAAGTYLYDYIALQQKRLPLYPEKMADYEYIRESQTLFDKAEKAVANNPELLDRVKYARVCVDITTLYFRSRLYQEFMKKGRKAEEYPYPTLFIRDRIIATLKSTHDPLVLSIGRSSCDNNDEVKKPIAEYMINYVTLLSKGKDIAPLPEQFRNIPAEHIMDLRASDLSKGDSKLVPDDDSLVGVAVCRENSNEMPVAAGVWDFTATPQTNLISLKIESRDIPAEGYHIYKIGRAALSLKCRFWFSNSWQISKELGPFQDPQNMTQEWDFYVSVKLTGPSYPHGKKDEKDALYIDRLILVKHPAARVSAEPTGKAE